MHYSNLGSFYPDYQTMDKAREIADFIKTIPDGETANLHIATELLINAIRLLIKQGKIRYNEIAFKYKDILLLPDKYGMLDSWPRGFCDIPEDILEQLIIFPKSEKG